jgi:H/ACA ribonucleoprotein complex subunit 4
MALEEKGFIVKEECEGKFGKFPEERTIEEKINNGLVIIDKPAGPTSHQVSCWVREILGVRKAGHAGTLDPGVTGLLPIAFGKATKIMLALKGADKEYIGTMALSKKVEADKIIECAKSFVGLVEQIPPEFSAVKKVPRTRRIFYLDILEVEENFILFKIGCEAGFYVRVFCEQFGSALNVEGKMLDLRRTKFNCFTENDLTNLQELKDNFVLWKNGEDNDLSDILRPVEDGVKHLKKIFIKDSAINSVCRGAHLGANGICKLSENIRKGETVALMSLKGELLALGRSFFSSQEIMKMEKGNCVKTIRVFYV